MLAGGGPLPDDVYDVEAKSVSFLHAEDSDAADDDVELETLLPK